MGTGETIETGLQRRLKPYGAALEAATARSRAFILLTLAIRLCSEARPHARPLALVDPRSCRAFQTDHEIGSDPSSRQCTGGAIWSYFD
jgi:hypothetical protein